MSGFDEWSDSTVLADREYLTSVTSAVYVMASGGTANLYRSGVIGKNQQANNAAKRLGQLNGGTLKEHAPWRFAFLAPLSADLAVGLASAEQALQSALASVFDTDRRSLFYTDNLPLVVTTAKRAVETVIADDQTKDHSRLVAAIESYLEANDSPVLQPFAHARAVTAAKDVVFNELRRSLSPDLARLLLEGLKAAG